MALEEALDVDKEIEQLAEKRNRLLGEADKCERRLRPLYEKFHKLINQLTGEELNKFAKRTQKEKRR